MTREYEDRLEAELRAIEDSYAVNTMLVLTQFCKEEGIALSDAQIARLGRELEEMVKDERNARHEYKAKQQRDRTIQGIRQKRNYRG